MEHIIDSSKGFINGSKVMILDIPRYDPVLTMVQPNEPKFVLNLTVRCNVKIIQRVNKTACQI